MGWSVSDYYAAIGAGPSSGDDFAVWVVGSTFAFSGGNRCFFSNGSTSLAAGAGFYEIEFDNYTCHALVEDSVTLRVSSGVLFGSTFPTNLKCFTALISVHGGNLHFFLNGKEVLPAIALTGAVPVSAGTNRFIIGARSDLAAPCSGGVLGVGGISDGAGALPSDLEILDWHLRCVDNAGIATMTNETHRWDSRDQSPVTGTWTDRVAADTLTKVGSNVFPGVHVPVWL